MNIFSSTKDKPSQWANSGPINIHHLETRFIFDEPIVRSLVTEANSIFKSVQELSKKETRPDYLTMSRTYRSTVRACLEKLQDSLSMPDDYDDKPKGVIENYITIFYSVECVWHLCEILLIDRVPSNIIVPQLLEWTRFHFPSFERKAAEMLFVEHDDIDDINSEMMPIVKGLIMQGQVEVGRTILRLHALADNTSFRIVDEILKSMPVYNV